MRLMLNNMNFRGATPETVKKAFEILLADPSVKSIFINIFGGLLSKFLVPLLYSRCVQRYHAL